MTLVEYRIGHRLFLEFKKYVIESDLPPCILNSLKDIANEIYQINERKTLTGDNVITLLNRVSLLRCSMVDSARFVNLAVDQVPLVRDALNLRMFYNRLSQNYIRKRVSKKKLSLPFAVQAGPVNMFGLPAQMKKTPLDRINANNSLAHYELNGLRGLDRASWRYPSTLEDREGFKRERQFRQADKRFYCANQQLVSSRVSCAVSVGKSGIQEDHCLVAPISFCMCGKTFQVESFALFKGHGSGGAGGFASSNFVEILTDSLKEESKTWPYGEADFHDVLKKAVSRLHEMVCKLPDPGGTTAVIGVYFQDKLWVANVGDSGALINRKGLAIPLSIPQIPLCEMNRREDSTYNKALDIGANKYAIEVMKRGALPEPYWDAAHGFFLRQTGEGMRSELWKDGKDHLRTARSIGDPAFDICKKSSPEIFMQPLLPGDLIVLYSKGTAESPAKMVEVIQRLREQEVPVLEIVAIMAQATTTTEDTSSVLIVELDAGRQPEQNSWLQEPSAKRQKLDEVDMRSLVTL